MHNYKSKDLLTSPVAERVKFYEEVLENGSALIDMPNHEMKVECTFTVSAESAMQQYQMMGSGGFSKLLGDTGEFNVRWDKRFPNTLFTFKKV